MNKQLAVGDRLQILYEQEQEYYMTTVKAVNRENFIIDEPTSGGKVLEMPPYSSWQFCLIKDDAVYFFSSRINGVEITGDESSYLVKPPYYMQRQQRRFHVRVPCHLELMYWLWDEINTPGENNPARLPHDSGLREDPEWIADHLKTLESRVPGEVAFTLDMSGGGIRMVTLNPLKRNDYLQLKISLFEKQQSQLLLLEGRVVRVVPLNIGGWKRYRVGVSFINIDHKVQERIISYLFKLMRNKI